MSSTDEPAADPSPQSAPDRYRCKVTTDDFLPFSGWSIGLAGPMLGGNEGWVTSQHEILAERMRSEGARVFTTSSHPGRFPRLVDTVNSVLRWRGRVDVIVIAVFSGPGFRVAEITSRVAQMCGIPQILVLHGGNLPNFAQQHERRVRALFSRASGVVAPSQYLPDQLRLDRDIQVIPNVFDIGTIPFRVRTEVHPRILWRRTFHELYEPRLALEVLVRVRQHAPTAELTMAGQDKGLLRSCRQHAARLGVDGAVRFVGFLDEAGKRTALDSHDVFLNTNSVDNAPVSVLEAAAAGIPIAATNVGGIPYLFEDGVSALLRTNGDAVGLAEAVTSLITEPGLGAKLSLNARQIAELSDWNTVRARWLERFRVARRGA